MTQRNALSRSPPPLPLGRAKRVGPLVRFLNLLNPERFGPLLTSPVAPRIPLGLPKIRLFCFLAPKFRIFLDFNIFFADRKIIKNRTPPKRDRKVVTIDIRRPPGRPKPPLLKKTLISSLILEAIFHEKSMQKSMLSSKPQKS